MVIYRDMVETESATMDYYLLYVIGRNMIWCHNPVLTVTRNVTHMRLIAG